MEHRGMQSSVSLPAHGAAASMNPSRPSPTASTPAEADAIAAAARLLPQVRAAREECELRRHVPPAMADALGEAGLLQMLFSRSMGGLELSPLAAFHIVEEISRADGSIGW